MHVRPPVHLLAPTAADAYGRVCLLTLQIHVSSPQPALLTMSISILWVYVFDPCKGRTEMWEGLSGASYDKKESGGKEAVEAWEPG